MQRQINNFSRKHWADCAPDQRYTSDVVDHPDILTELFVSGTPLIDVRAPVEHRQGAFPNAFNLPLMTDKEREAVGICYKQSGQQAAIKLGHELVSGEVKAARVGAWRQYINAHPDAQLYCFRGGKRSEIACDWLRAEGINIQRVEGGYKRMRSHLIGVLESFENLLIVSGKTGSGKTRFIERFNCSVDLEGIANHRGSAFGGHLAPQPGQIDFENTVAIDYLKQNARRGKAPVLLEDEGRLIGRISLPAGLQTAMKSAPIIVLDETLDTRVNHIFDEYVVEQWQTYQAQFDNAQEPYTNYLLNAVDAIRKRLGGVAHAQVRQTMIDAMKQQAANKDQSKHKQWIEQLLVNYYDPMYEYQLSQKTERVQARGTATELSHWYHQQFTGT